MTTETMRIVQAVFGVINVFFILYLIGYSTFLFLSVAVGATTLYRKRREAVLNNVEKDAYFIPVTIVVPAYNEEVTVVDTVNSLLALDYKVYEIVVVNDGSKDNTSQVLVDAFNMKKIQRPIRNRVPSQPVESVYECFDEKVPLTLINKKNGGKADALNMGINASNYPYFICMDADSMLQYDSLREIVRPVLENDNVVAVGGSVRPANGAELALGRVRSYHLPKNLLACMQTLEYDRSFLAARILLDKINASLIISGAFGFFHKDTVIAAGGYDQSTMGEDMELVVKLHEYCTVNNRPYLIKYATNAICWTQVPENLSDLCKQRKRWHRGLYQCMKIHRSMLGDSRYPMVSLVAYPYFLLYELYSPYIELFGLFSMAVAYFVDLLNVPYMLLFFAIYAFFGVIMTLTAFFSRIQTIDLTISFSDALKAIGLCALEVVCLRFIMATVRMRALIGINNKDKLQWGRIERKKLSYKGRG